MMRPILTLLVAKEFGGVEAPSQSAAISLELLHTASLVHDDVVDEAGERRGQASVNDTYGNKIAVLLGDYLLSLSLSQAAKTNSIDAVRIISNLGGTLSEGEIFQLDNINKDELSEDAYFHIIERKTAALFSACAQLGAITAGADAHQVETARRLGEIIGVCFQIRDDIFDYFKTDIGKPTGNDMKEGKLTLPVIHALFKEASDEMFDIAYKVKDGTVAPEEVERLVKFTKDNGGIDYAYEVMERYAAEAKALLEKYPDSSVKTSLFHYIDYVIGRKL
jgi:octaprenyl-diphosphate synthase